MNSLRTRGKLIKYFYVVWASIINTVNSTGVPDFLIFLLVLLLFGVGIGVGFLTIDYAIGSLALGAVGGLSIGMRVVLLREGLLVPLFIINWVVVGVFGLLGSVAVVTNERIGVVRPSVRLLYVTEKLMSFV